MKQTKKQTNKGLSQYRQKLASARIKACYIRANRDVLKRGLNWYKQAHVFCKEVAHNTGLTVETVAMVVSALSPAVSWELNKIQAEQMCNAFRDGLPLETVTTSTYENNRLKAWDILQGKKVITVKSPKTYAFYRNLLLDVDSVTVDRWMLRIMFNRPLKSLTALKYRQCEKILRQAANDLDLKPFQLQAITWEQIRIEA
jgi:hypothetical protein